MEKNIIVFRWKNNSNPVLLVPHSYLFLIPFQDSSINDIKDLEILKRFPMVKG